MKATVASYHKKRGSSFSILQQFEITPDVGCGRIFRVNYLSRSGKWVHLLKLLALVFIPIIGGWGFTLFSLADSVTMRHETVEAQETMGRAITLGRLIYTIQRERDMGILYISKIGPGTKSFLIEEYDRTDFQFTEMWSWPDEFTTNEKLYFRSKKKLTTYINQHRTQLDPNMSKAYDEIKFYGEIVDFIMDWMVTNIRESGFGNIWKSLVVFQKLTRCMLDTGAERAYGAMFYAQGNFPDINFYDFYFRRIHRFNYNYRSAVVYSDLVDSLKYDETGQRNITAAVLGFRNEIRQSNISLTYKSTVKAEDYYDNVTYRVDFMFQLQEKIAERIIRLINASVTEMSTSITIYSLTAVIVFLACPVIVFFSDALVNNIQNYSRVLLKASNDLDKEKHRTDSLLYQMLPKPVVRLLKEKSKVESEFFKSATIMFTSIVDFTQLSMEYTPLEVIELLNSIYTSIDGRIENYDVYKVETINDTYMVVSGVPIRNGTQHATEIAYLGLDIVRMIKQTSYTSKVTIPTPLLIGISTGPVSAGIVGTAMLRYCLFGDTVNIASRMKSNSLPNRIHISESTYRNLNKTRCFKLQSRGAIEVKGKGKMNTFWLVEALQAMEHHTMATQWRLPGEVDSIESFSDDGTTVSAINTTNTTINRKQSQTQKGPPTPLLEEVEKEEYVGY